MRFAGAAKTGVPAEVTDFVTRFFESMKKDWRSGIQFMDPENYKAMRANDPQMTGTAADASVLVFAISLIRFQGSDHPRDTDSEMDRLQKIREVRVQRFEANEQVYSLGGETELDDGRVYGLQLVIARQKLAVLGPL